MPAQVVVVKRSRRRAFAVLRAVPAWLRAFVSTLSVVLQSRRSKRGGATPAFEIDTIEAFRESGLQAPERSSGIMCPRVELDATVLGCPECRRCVEICPSHALELSSPIAVGDDTPSGARDMQLELDSGRCIGCAECVRVCPSQVLVMDFASNRVGEGKRPLPRDLFIDARNASLS